MLFSEMEEVALVESRWTSDSSIESQQAEVSDRRYRRGARDQMQSHPSREGVRDGWDT